MVDRGLINSDGEYQKVVALSVWGDKSPILDLLSSDCYVCLIGSWRQKVFGEITKKPIRWPCLEKEIEGSLVYIDNIKSQKTASGEDREE